jgi:hypothetical protein
LLASQAALDKAVGAAIHGGKKGAALFAKTMKGLTDGGSTD